MVTILCFSSAPTQSRTRKPLATWKSRAADIPSFAEVLETQRLEWAFAGTSNTELCDVPDGGQIAHSIWKHFVDSKHVDADAVVDEGDMFPQPAPNEKRTLEKGRMVNPINGRPTDYEEVWKDVPLTSTNREGGTIYVVVLVLLDEEHRARGMVVRVGQFCQGVLRVGEGFACERWEWRWEDGWTRRARIGDLFLPCGAAMEEGKLRVGGCVKYGEYEWRVIELVDQ